MFAHRGASLERPENTHEAFVRALELGADALETDVHLTYDGHLVVAHDPDGRRTAGVDRPIRETTLGAMRAWNVGRSHGVTARVITLHELLEAFPDVLVNVDLKPDSMAAARELVRVIDERGARDRVIAASFSARNTVRLLSLGHRQVGLSRAEAMLIATTPARLLRKLFAGRAAQLPLALGSVPLPRPWLVDRCRRAGLRLDFWTVNTPEDARRIAALGVDGIMTDDPGTIAPVLADIPASPSGSG